MISKSKKLGLAAILMALLAGRLLAAGYVWDNFESYIAGTNLSTLVAQGWGASSTGVFVTSNVLGNTTKLVELDPATCASNTVNQPAASERIWTDYLLNETARWIPSMLPTNTPNTMVMVGVTTAGYAVVYNTASNGWDTCTKDARGSVVAALADGTWAELSVCQDFATNKVSLFLNGRLLREGIPFITHQTGYSGIRFTGGIDCTGYVDNVYVSNAVPSALATQSLSSTNDINRDGLVDAVEIMQYGVLAKVVPDDYPSIAAALSVASSGARIVVNGNRVESLLVSNNITLVGTNLTGLAALTVHSNRTVVLSGYSAVDVASLVIQSGGTLQLINSTLTANGTTLTGNFTLNSGWGVSPLPSSLNFTDDFESYSENLPLALCGGDGWGASSAGTIVQGLVTNQSAKAAKVMAESSLSNVVAGLVPQANVWTDLYLQDSTLRYTGVQYPPTNANRAVMLFVNTNNHVVIWNSNAWDECAADAFGGGAPTVATGTWARVSVYEDFMMQKIALFVNGQLLRQQVPFVSPVARYQGLSLSSGNGASYLDDVKIWTNMPASLTNYSQSVIDLDHDGIPDAQEIVLYGNLAAYPRGSVFKIR